MTTCKAMFGRDCVPFDYDNCRVCGTRSAFSEKAKRAQEIADRLEARWKEREPIGHICGVPVHVQPLVHDFEGGDLILYMHEQIAIAHGHGVEIGRYILSYNDGRKFVEWAERRCVAKSRAFTDAEVEAIRDYGSRCYAERAADVEQIKVLRAEIEEQEEDERIRVALGPIWGYRTDGDWDGQAGESMRRQEEHNAEARREFLARLTPPLPFEGPGDWAARHGVSPTYWDADSFDKWREMVTSAMEKVARGETP